MVLPDFSAAQETTTVVVTTRGRCSTVSIHLGAWADLSGALTPTACAGRCGSPDTPGESSAVTGTAPVAGCRPGRRPRCTSARHRRSVARHRGATTPGTDLVQAYLAAWNETDPAARKAAIDAVDPTRATLTRSPTSAAPTGWAT